MQTISLPELFTLGVVWGFALCVLWIYIYRHRAELLEEARSWLADEPPDSAQSLRDQDAADRRARDLHIFVTMKGGRREH